MKKVFFFQNRTVLKNTPLFQFFGILSMLLLSSHLVELRAQQDPVLSIQGILKKASGEAVSDGNYDITFKLYKNAETGQPVWTEQQMDVEVISGIYSTVLGNTVPLNIAFDTIYYLGVTVGSTEMKPRIQLTSAPYALALIGESNKFPSSGLVKADSVQLKGGVLARAGIPGANGVNRNGYAFMANNGKKDSGLFSTPTSGNVSLYVANSEKLKATADSVVIKEDLRLTTGSNINYNGLDDWRLVEVDNFTTDNEQWKTYAPKNANEGNGWNNLNSPAPVNCPTAGDATKFIGKYLAPSENNLVLKKQFDLSAGGSFTQIKVKFKYYFLDTWNPVTDGGSGGNDIGWGAFATSEDGSQFRLSWWEHAWSTDYIANMNVAGSLFPAANKWGGVAGFTDFMKNGEMTAYRNGTDTGVWVMFGTGLNNGFADERWGVGMIEIWVK